MNKGGQRTYSHKDNIRTQNKEPLTSNTSDTSNRIPQAPSIPSSFTSIAYPGSTQFDQNLIDKKHHLQHVPRSMIHDASQPDLSSLQQQQQQQQQQQRQQQQEGRWERAGMQGAGFAQQLPSQGFVREEAVQYLKEERPPVLKEKILPIEEESIQPVIHREVERREIHEVLQPIHEKQILAPVVEEKQLPAEYRPQVGTYVARTAPLAESSLRFENVEKHRFVNAPIIEETVKKTIVEEVQPVIHRETVAPHIIRETLPIYEKFVEPEVILKETRPVIESSGRQIPESTLAPTPVMAEKALVQETAVPVAQKFVFDIEQKTKIIPHVEKTTVSRK